MTQQPKARSQRYWQAQERMFLYHLGRAVTQWALVEDCLFEICGAILGASPRHVAILYHRTPTLDARLTLVHELMRTVLPQPLRKNGGHPEPVEKAWNALVNDVKDALPTRNHLVHSTSAFSLDSDLDLEAHINLMVRDPTYRLPVTYASYSSRPELLRGRSSPKFLVLKDVKDHTASVRALAERLYNFHRDELPVLLGSLARKGSRPKGPHPETRPPTKRGTRPRSSRA